jgi:RNA polymerase sigma-70 factor (ECF subfamily)
MNPSDSEQDSTGSDDEALAGQPPFELPLQLPSDALQEELVRRAQAGDVEALNELFARYYDAMVSAARRRLGPRLRLKEEADDLAQTTFREATRDFAQYQYRGPSSFLNWLGQILRNKIRDKAEYYAASKRDAARELTSDETGPEETGTRKLEAPSTDLSVTTFVQRNEEIDILREALEKLSPDHRAAITLVFFQGLTFREAGEQMDGRTEDAVRMLLRRAESRLRELTRERMRERES